MPSITIRNLSEDTKARLSEQARNQDRSLEAYVRTVLDEAARQQAKPADAAFPCNLIALVEPGEDLEPLIDEQDQHQNLVEL